MTWFVVVRQQVLSLALLLMGAAILATDGQSAAGSEAALPPAGNGYGVPELWTRVQSDEVNESSGVAASRTRDGLLWTHNDSGGAPCLYALNRSGMVVQRVTIEGVANLDWEDLAGFTRNGRSFLAIADTGDNDCRRESVAIHIVEEPVVGQDRVPVTRSIKFRLPSGRQDCEALSYDATADRLLLITKLSRKDALGLITRQPTNQVRVLAIPLEQQPGTDGFHMAEEIAQLQPIVVTSMDISSDGRRAIVLSYLGAWLFERSENETWDVAFSRAPFPLAMPVLRQPEAICFSANSKDVFLTSEHAPMPVWKIAYVGGEAPTPSRTDTPSSIQSVPPVSE